MTHMKSILLFFVMSALSLYAMENEITSKQQACEETRHLIECAKANKLDAKQLLSEADEDNFTLLHYAAQMHNVNEIKLLLNHGANINAQGKNGDLPMHLAIKSCNGDVTHAYETIKLLYESGSEIHGNMKHWLLILRMHNPEHTPLFKECLRLLSKERLKKGE